MRTPPSSRIRILDAAALVLKTKGLNGTKLSEIAKFAGMLAPSLYHHFASKDQLVEAVILEGIYRNTRHIVTRVEALGATASSIERLEAAIVAHVSFLVEGDDYSSAASRVFNDLTKSARRRVLAAYTSFDNYWRDLIVAVQRDGKAYDGFDPGVVRKFMVGMLDATPAWYRKDRLDAHAIAQQACRLLVHGFVRGES